MKKEYLAHFFLIIESLLYAGSYTVANDASTYISPFELTLLRAIFAAIIFGTFQFISVREKVDKQDLLLLAVCSLFGITISNVLFFGGLARTTPVNASLLTLTSPLFLIVFAIIARGEIAAGKLIGVLIGTIGGVLLVWGDTGLMTNAVNPILGNIMVGASAGSYAIYLILVRPLLLKYHPLTILKWVFTFGILYLLPVWGWGLTKIEWSEFNASIWIALAFILIGITFITFLLNTFALKVLDPTIVSTYIYTTPLFTALIGVFLDGDSSSLSLLIAGILILFGGFLVSQTNEIQKKEIDSN
ncbi:MAG: EamA family transporter [uncultured Aureispira sp.]|uniref:EamA family transporter n=1 Tax=uncultured Aureispira sp. TaxID=1331704 RepID=A0A6S6UF44_9BACT|nr:MAG: EamA family transporter [uncultured Aureispira sp.]